MTRVHKPFGIRRILPVKFVRELRLAKDQSLLLDLLMEPETGAGILPKLFRRAQQ
jgi:hypothetical protein